MPILSLAVLLMYERNTVQWTRTRDSNCVFCVRVLVEFLLAMLRFASSFSSAVMKATENHIISMEFLVFLCTANTKIIDNRVQRS